MINLFILVPDVNTVMGAGFTLVRVYTDTSPTGTFLTLDGTITLVADTVSYTYTDADGTDATWYKTAYWGVVPGESAKSEARQGDTSAAYATVPELRAMIDLDAETDDVQLAKLLDGAAQAIDRFCNELGFVASPIATDKHYKGNGLDYLLIDKCVEITAVAVKDSITDASYTAWNSPSVNMAGDGDWYACSGDPEAPDFDSFPWDIIMVDINGDESRFTSGGYDVAHDWPRRARGRGGRRRSVPTVQVTARWGYADWDDALPNISIANLMLAARWYKRLQGSMSDALASGELGRLIFVQKIDPDIAFILTQGRYKIPATGRR